MVGERGLNSAEDRLKAAANRAQAREFYFAERNKLWNEVSDMSQGHWSDEKDEREKYAKYLASREWAILKEAVKRRSGGVCERCKINKSDAVHHLTYKRKYRENLDDLQDICTPCHEFTHGKSDEDPCQRTVVIGGLEMESVYLAGKIHDNHWRKEILPDWMDRKRYGWGYADEYWGVMWADFSEHTFCSLPDGRSLRYGGPYWVYDDAGTGGHGKQGAVTERNSLKIARNVRHAIESTDILFAWIDSTDCFGTLTEIGMAAAHDFKYVAVAVKRGLDVDELWLSLEMADVCFYADSAGDAWKSFWKYIDADGSLTLEQYVFGQSQLHQLPLYVPRKKGKKSGSKGPFEEISSGDF